MRVSPQRINKVSKQSGLVVLNACNLKPKRWDITHIYPSVLLIQQIKLEK